MRIVMRSSVAAVVLTVLTTLGPVPAAWADDVVVFAAASLKNALDNASHAFSGAGGAPVKISYAASSQLAKQIESGAPADIFISADLAWMDYLQKRNLIQPATRKNLLGNQLVLVAPADSNVKVDIKPGFDLVGLLDGGRLAMADPASVPAGKYGKAALQKLDVWDAVQLHVAGAENVRAALLFVDRQGDTARHRLRHRRRVGSQGQNRRGLSRGYAPANHLPGGVDRGEQEPRRGQSSSSFSNRRRRGRHFEQQGFTLLGAAK